VVLRITQGASRSLMSCSVSGEHLVIAAHVLLAGELVLENRRAAGSAT
jgi:hypothetical protein